MLNWGYTVAEPYFMLFSWQRDPGTWSCRQDDGDWAIVYWVYIVWLFWVSFRMQSGAMPGRGGLVEVRPFRLTFGMMSTLFLIYYKLYITQKVYYIQHSKSILICFKSSIQDRWVNLLINLYLWAYPYNLLILTNQITQISNPSAHQPCTHKNWIPSITIIWNKE